MIMSLFSKLPLFVYIVWSFYLNKSISGSTYPPVDDRIVNGVECDIHEVPSAVLIISRISNNGAKYCSGTLITEKWILTAAHCVNLKSIKYNTRALMGTSHEKVNSSGVQVRRISRGEIYDKYVGKGKDKYENRYDIGLLYTPQPFNMSENVKLAKLPSSKDFTSSCSSVTVAGWGRTDPTKPGATLKPASGPKILNCADVKLMFDLKQCVKEAPTSRWKIGDSMLCLPVAGDGAGICFGDSGGPVYCGHDVIVGVISSTFGCGQPGLFSFAMRVDDYFSFIAKHTGMKVPFKSEPSDKLIDTKSDTKQEKSEDTTEQKRNSSWALFGDGYPFFSVFLVILNISCCIIGF